MSLPLAGPRPTPWADCLTLAAPCKLVERQSHLVAIFMALDAE
jgi:hypothetical protein